jgi:hypothetical protein
MSAPTRPLRKFKRYHHPRVAAVADDADNAHTTERRCASTTAPRLTMKLNVSTPVRQCGNTSKKLTSYSAQDDHDSYDVQARQHDHETYKMPQMLGGHPDRLRSSAGSHAGGQDYTPMTLPIANVSLSSFLCGF